jgi:hypothetical protein
VDDAATHRGYQRQTSNVTSVGGTIMREGKIRLLSIGMNVTKIGYAGEFYFFDSADNSGTAIFWDGDVMGNIVQVEGPTARVQVSKSLLQFLIYQVLLSTCRILLVPD